MNSQSLTHSQPSAFVSDRLPSCPNIVPYHDTVVRHLIYELLVLLSISHHFKREGRNQSRAKPSAHPQYPPPKWYPIYQIASAP